MLEKLVMDWICGPLHKTRVHIPVLIPRNQVKESQWESIEGYLLIGALYKQKRKFH